MPDNDNFVANLIRHVESDESIDLPSIELVVVAAVNLREGQADGQPKNRVADFRVSATNGKQYHLSVRAVTTEYPIDKIDCLEDSFSSAPVHCIIVYLVDGSSLLDANTLLDSTVEVEVLPQRYVLANCWLSVTHVYWGKDHPFTDVTLRPRPLLPDAQLNLLEGGTRGEKSDFLISVITIVYNGDELLEQTLQAVIHQKTDDIEHVIVDGGSSDGTLALLNRYGGYLDYWRSERDDGLYDALNKGVSLCRGVYVGAIHANDCYAFDALKKIRDAVQNRPDAEFVYGVVNNIGDDRAWRRGREIMSGWQMVTFGNFNHPTCFVKRSVYERIGSFNLHYTIAGDYDFGIRCWNAGVKFCYVDELISHFRLGGTSSNLFRNQWQRHHIRIANGVTNLYSLVVFGLVLANYSIKRPIRWSLDQLVRFR
ncbi:MAG: GT2 family glycosyltransferase [Candidatus Azotimanducaceae bacterium]|jgi:GT2 family glycosyltransferase